MPGLISLMLMTMSAAGSPSLVGWYDALPHKPKNHLNSPKFGIILIYTVISIVHHKKPLRLAFGTSMYNIWLF